MNIFLHVKVNLVDVCEWAGMRDQKWVTQYGERNMN